jgi:starch-binding outer membrane protein, SusD/RagB family
MRKLLFYLSGLLVLFVYSCSKTEINPSNLINDEIIPVITSGTIDSFCVLPVYQKLHAITGCNQADSRGDVFQQQSFCTDEALIPTRYPGDWYDGGSFQRWFTHSWTPEEAEFGTLWKFSYDIINLANLNIHYMPAHFPGMDSLTQSPVSKLKALRSLGYYYLIDFFGNVPIITKYDSANTRPANNGNFATGRKNLFDTIVNDITTCLPYLSPAFDNSTFGTFNKWTGFALLSKMYINAEVWTGSPMYDECIAACDSIINSGLFSLSSDYFSNFKQANQNSKENIFVVPYNQASSELNEGFYFMSLHYNSYLTYQTLFSPWNGFCALPDHYYSFESNDVRRNGWNVGPQFAADGTTPIHLVRAPYANDNLNFTADFIDIYDTVHPLKGDTLNYSTALENSGARLVKYEIAPGLPHNCLGVPLAIFRYADIILLKAEAIMRKNGGTATEEAVDLVNQIRTRAGVSLYSTSTLTLNELLAERGREFYYEGVRRQDLVRFEKFVKGTWGRNFSGPYQSQWFDRSGEGSYRNVYPIPYSQLTSNSNLHQNPGY